VNAFWQHKDLQELSRDEWESLCDGCGRCCLVKLEDSDTGKVHYTNITCRLLDTKSCRCTDYVHRKEKVAACFVLTPETIKDYPYLPPTCAYRRLDEGKALPAWHPLITGDGDSVISSGISVIGKTISEQYVHADDCRDYIVNWPIE